jgi:hypothetical protein
MDEFALAVVGAVVGTGWEKSAKGEQERHAENRAFSHGLKKTENPKSSVESPVMTAAA